MKARLVAFKSRRRDVSNNYGIIEVDVGNAALLIGRKVTWRSDGGKKIAGVIIRTHGRDGLLVRFRKGLPGNALGAVLELKEKPKKVKAAQEAKKKKAPAKKRVLKKEAKKEKAPAKKKKKAPAKKKPTTKTTSRKKSKAKSEKSGGA